MKNERFEPVSNTVYPSRADAQSNNSSTFVYHGLDLDEYSFAENKGSYLLFLGAIHPRKNVEMAIKVAKWTDMPLVIVGPVRHPGYFCKKVRKKLNDKITYHGEAMGEIKNHLLKNAKALLYPSSWESFGLSVIEAMAMGKPVLTTRVGSIPDLVDHDETGILVPAKDVRALAENLDRLITDDDLRRRLGQNARAMAVYNYSVQENIRGLERIYRDMT